MEKHQVFPKVSSSKHQMARPSYNRMMRGSKEIKNGRPKKKSKWSSKESPCPLAMIKSGRPKKLDCSSAVIKNGRLKKSHPSLVLIKNDRPKKLAHFQDQAMILQTSKKTFKRQILRGRHKNTIILEEENS